MFIHPLIIFFVVRTADIFCLSLHWRTMLVAPHEQQQKDFRKVHLSMLPLQRRSSSRGSSHQHAGPDDQCQPHVLTVPFYHQLVSRSEVTLTSPATRSASLSFSLDVIYYCSENNYFFNTFISQVVEVEVNELRQKSSADKRMQVYTSHWYNIHFRFLQNYFVKCKHTSYASISMEFIQVVGDVYLDESISMKAYLLVCQSTSHHLTHRFHQLHLSLVSI